MRSEARMMWCWPMSLEVRERATAAAVSAGDAPPLLSTGFANHQQVTDTTRPLGQSSGSVATWPEMGESAKAQRKAEKAGEGLLKALPASSVKGVIVLSIRLLVCSFVL